MISIILAIAMSLFGGATQGPPPPDVVGRRRYGAPAMSTFGGAGDAIGAPTLSNYVGLATRKVPRRRPTVAPATRLQ